MSGPRLSERARRIEPSPTVVVMAEAKRLLAAGIDVVDFGPGEPDFPTPAPISEAAIAAIRAGETKYTDGAGTPALRKALADRYNGRHGTAFGPKNVIVGAGGKQPLHNACLALFEAGDEVLVPEPTWVSFREMVRLADATPVPVATREEDSFQPTPELLESSFTPRTRGVILCSPSNPHGGILGSGALRRIVEICAARGAVVLFDETYDAFVYDGAHVSPAPLAREFPDTVFTFGTFSKSWAMTGWRVGWMVGAEPAVTAMANIQSHTTTNACSVSQAAALFALSPEGLATVPPMIAEYRRRRDVLVDGLGRIPGIRCALPAGAFYAFPNVSALYGRAGIANSTDLARRLLDDARVATTPGIAFGNDAHLRFSFATSMERIEEGLRRIRAFVAG